MQFVVFFLPPNVSLQEGVVLETCCNSSIDFSSKIHYLNIHVQIQTLAAASSPIFSGRLSSPLIASDQIGFVRPESSPKHLICSVA